MINLDTQSIRRLTDIRRYVSWIEIGDYFRETGDAGGIKKFGIKDHWLDEIEEALTEFPIYPN